MFPVRYELDFNILFRINSVFKGLIRLTNKEQRHFEAFNETLQATSHHSVNQLYVCIAQLSVNANLFPT
jgi:hypothetical protein